MWYSILNPSNRDTEKNYRKNKALEQKGTVLKASAKLFDAKIINYQNMYTV